VFTFSLKLLSETFLILRIIQQDIIIIVQRYSSKATIIIIVMKLEFYRFSKNPQILNFMIIHIVGAKTNMTRS